MKEVKKKWGKEVWLVNEPEYCGKLLYIDKGASSSIHYHPKKKETFYCGAGAVLITSGDEGSIYYPDSEPVTIPPMRKHLFYGLLERNILIEISTHHEDDDVVRLTKSRGPSGKRIYSRRDRD